MAKILVIDDNLDICQLLDRFLTKKGHDVDTTISGTKGLELVSEKQYDLIFCDFQLREMKGRDILMNVKKISPNTKVAIITGYADVRIAVEMIQIGAFDYVVKPLIPDEILVLIDRALNEKAVDIKDRKKPGSMVEEDPCQISNQEYIWGTGKASKSLLKEIKLVAPTNFSVIIYGESGAGKENIAKTIHDLSERKGKSFVAIDCGALTNELAGSELWGHEKGAFTGAIMSKTGQFELANGGTIFLDEISNLSYEIQVGLLRLVQERKLRRIGGSKDKEIDVRIIVASNEDLRKSVAQGKFREDLYFRFNEFSITVPPLRNRGSDIMEFARHFLGKANKELNKKTIGFSDEVIHLFSKYSWPGNLREMKNVIRRACLLTDSDYISLSAIPQEVVHAGKFTFSDLSPINNQQQPFSSDCMVKEDLNLKDVAASAEAEAIKKVLEESHYNKSRAAQLLGIDRKTLFNKIKQYKLG
jgi:two-component system response regulator HydG